VWRYEGNNAFIYACRVCSVTLQIIKKISEINCRRYYPQLKLLCKAHVRGRSAGDSQLAPIIMTKNQAASALPRNLSPQWQSINDSYNCCIFPFNYQYLKPFSSHNQYSTKHNDAARFQTCSPVLCGAEHPPMLGWVQALREKPSVHRTSNSQRLLLSTCGFFLLPDRHIA